MILITFSFEDPITADVEMWIRTIFQQRRLFQPAVTKYFLYLAANFEAAVQVDEEC